jgi:sulfonate transport system substrate-binding protein
MDRRKLILSAAALTAAAAWPSSFACADQPKELRIGFQKISVLLIVKARKQLEKRFEPQGTSIKWVEFQFGPPLLEALGAGAIDYGYTGDSPPIFAQAAHAKIVYAAALARGYGQGIIVPASSSIKLITDLKGKKVGVGKASSGHNLLIASLEAAHLKWEDITPVYLAPADATAAFSRGAIDAWSIWDPFLAIAELNAGARQLELDRAATTQNSFFLANSEFAAQHSALLHAITDEIGKAEKWAESHRDEAAALYADASGVPLEAQKKSVARAEFAVGPLTDNIIAQQQAVADRFQRIGLIPEKINVRDIVWK